jgi:hypothetical protein
MTQDAKVSKIVKTYKELEKLNKDQHSKMKKLYKAWGKFIHKTDYPWQSKSFYPKCFEVASVVMSRIFNRDFSIKLTDPTSESYDKAYRAETAINYQRKMADFRKDDEDLIQYAVILGTGISKMKWYMTTYETEEGVKNPGEILVKTKEEYPKYEAVDPTEIFVDPTMKSIEDMPCIIHRHIYSRNELEHCGLYDKAVLSKVGKMPEDETRGLNSKEKNKISRSDELKSEYVEVIEYWGNVDGEERVISIANRDKIIRDEENPFGFRPFAVFRCSVDPASFWGIGIVEPTIGIQEEYNFLANGVMDSITMQNLGMYWLDPDSNIDNKDKDPYPGKVWNVRRDEMGAVAMEGPSLIGAVNMLTKINDDLQSSVGVHDVSRGVHETSRDTATGISLLQEAANERFQTAIENYKIFYKDIASQMMRLDKLFLTSDFYVPVQNGEKADKTRYDKFRRRFIAYFEIDKDDFDDYFVDVEVVGDSGSTIEAQRAKVDALLEMARSNPDIFNLKEAYKRALELMKVKDIQSLFLQEASSGPDESMDRVQGLLDQGESSQMSPDMEQQLIDQYAQAEQQLSPQGLQQ